MMLQITSFFGIFVFVGLCYLLSENKKAIRWKPVIGGILLQFLFAVLILKTDAGLAIFDGAKEFFNGLLSFSIEGAKFVFGPLANFEVSAKAFGPQFGFIFAFQISATIIFVSCLMAVIYHMG